MPKPNSGESQKDFVSRCIPHVMKEGTAKDNKQAAAICYSIYRQSHKKSSSAAFSIEFVPHDISMAEWNEEDHPRADDGKFTDSDDESAKEFAVKLHDKNEN